MEELIRYAAELDGVERRRPPVEQWTPEKSGDLDIVIRADGVWLHEGEPMRRARLVYLFSTILRREGDAYFLVTPVEKWRITVEDAPFVAISFKASGAGEGQVITFTTNLGDQFTAGPDHPLSYRAGRAGGAAPYAMLRAGLEARIARSVYYELVELGAERHIKDADVFGVWSDGVFHAFGPIDEIEA